MKHKIPLLITGCVLTVAALACIQAYFIKNTYKLYAREADHTIRQELLALETTGKLDSLNAVWMKKTTYFVAQYNEGTVTKSQYVDLIEKIRDSLSTVTNEFIKKNGFFEEYDVSYNNYVTQAVVFRGGGLKADTIFKGKMLLYGNKTDEAHEIPASQSKWDGSTVDAGCLGNKREFEVISSRTYSIANWQKQVLGKMLGLLVFSIILILLVIILFYWSIKNLITQKKIADIKTDFVNNITHEFQTPIAAMDIAVKTLQHKEAKLTPEQLSNTLAIISRQNQRMQKMVSQVTKASLSHHNINTEHAEALACNDVNEMVHDFMLSHPQVTFTCTASEGTSVYIDRLHLCTVLHNLLDNAIKYGGTDIAIAFKNTGKHVTLTVTDNGIGIPQKEKVAVFDKFYRVEKGNVHTTKGLGLGLHYVREIAEAYKGSISVSGNEGHGSTFTLLIPTP
ncbi:GHKL domain-containing protein [Flavobacterium sp. Sd200]|uniref:sensor histidine kinase n=1 Tax=Flavobacterium sp. Sd200 TaxID=2692211 RepID=UPI00136F7CD8|nr:HAMP domain-containing sensor histidine kinase [Flavobacterium sp. Sd200]MXN91031.1 GHKL domain-containing protein [Flavobacterium sp. Sd200]